MRFDILLICLHLLLPLTVNAQTLLKTPLSYSLPEYGFVLGMSLLGGLASWWMKVRAGEQRAWNLAALVGDLCISAFSGLIAFYLCGYFNLNPLLTPAIVGMAGHAGARGIKWVESIGQKIIEKKLGVEAAKEPS